MRCLFGAVHTDCGECAQDDAKERCFWEHEFTDFA
jgi:hypothetical protein